MREFLSEFESFQEKVVAFLRHELRTEDLLACSCHFECESVLESALYSGRRHPRAPTRRSNSAELMFNGRLTSGRVFQVVFSGLGYEEFIRAYQRGRMVAVQEEFPHGELWRRRYPTSPAASQELVEMLSDETRARRLDEVLTFLDACLHEIRSPRILGRYVESALWVRERRYFDSVGNTASERTTGCDVRLSFPLRDAWEEVTESFGTLPSPQELREVVERARQTLAVEGSVDIEAGEPPLVLLDPRALAFLFEEIVVPGLTGRSLLDGTGPWRTEDLGKEILPGVSMTDEPLLPHSPFSQAFDGEGIPSRRVVIVEAGRLAHPLMTSASLAELRECVTPEVGERLSLTGHAVSREDADVTNLQIGFPREDVLGIEELCAAGPRVVWVRSLSGTLIDPQTGQFVLDSDGAQVFEHGEAVGSASLVLRGNFFDILSDERKRIGPVQRVHNYWVPFLLTTSLACCDKGVV